MFGYEYVNLNATQVEARRELLDQAGVQAYFTPIILLMTIYAYRNLLHPVMKQYSSKDNGDILPSLRRSTFSLRRLHWLWTNTYIPEFGPLHVQLSGLLYTVFLLYMIVHNTGKDYMHATKAFGHVAVSQLPLHYLLSIKSPLSPITLATGLTHERLNAYHRLFGRIVHALLAVHAICYLKFFVDIGVLAKRVGDWDVRLGLMAFWTVNILGLLANPPVRAKVYHQVFYRSHVVLSAILLVVLWFHVPYTRRYVGQAAGLWVLNGMTRKGSAVTVGLSCKKASANASRLVHVTAKVKDGADSRWKQNWVPGMHGYLHQKGLGPKTPFTAIAVASNGTGAGTSLEVELVIRDLGGPMTGLLGTTANSESTTNTLELQLEGPYGEAKEYMPNLLEAAGRNKQGKILIVAGGVGATYALPIYTALLESRGGNTDGLSLIWIVKDIEDAMWGIDILQQQQQHRHKPGVQGSKINVQIHTTTTTKTNRLSDTINETLRLNGLQIFHSNSRPDLSQIVNNVFSSSSSQDRKVVDKDKVTVMVCGPSALSRSLRREVGRYVTETEREVEWFEEQFGFGGS